MPRGTTLQAGQIVDPLVHYAGRTEVQFVRQPAAHTLRELIALHRSQAADGHKHHRPASPGLRKGHPADQRPAGPGAQRRLGRAGKIELADLTISSDLELGHVVAVSLDGQPLAESREILLQVMTEEKPTNFQTQPAGSLRRITNIGQDPWLVKKIQGEVRLKRPDAALLRVTAGPWRLSPEASRHGGGNPPCPGHALLSHRSMTIPSARPTPRSAARPRAARFPTFWPRG